MSVASERRAAVERAFPGVICKRVSFTCYRFLPDNDIGSHFPDRRRYSLSICVEGSAEVLLGHGLIEQADIDRLPPSGKRSGFERTNRGTYQASLYWDDQHEDATKGRDMAAKIGITYVEPERPPREHTSRGRTVRVKTVGNVISIDWDALRARVALERPEVRAS